MTMHNFKPPYNHLALFTFGILFDAQSLSCLFQSHVHLWDLKSHSHAIQIHVQRALLARSPNIPLVV